MADLKYLWDNSTSAIFWGFVVAFLLTLFFFRLFKNIPVGSKYTQASTFWGLLMVALLSIELISLIGTFQARITINNVEESIKSYGGNALNIINIDSVINNIAPGLKRFINAENINKDAVDNVVSTYADSIRQNIDKQILKLVLFIIATLIILPMFIIKSKRYYDHSRNYSVKRSNYRPSRKHY